MRRRDSGQDWPSGSALLTGLLLVESGLSTGLSARGVLADWGSNRRLRRVVRDCSDMGGEIQNLTLITMKRENVVVGRR
jgi:hypothetical protein